MANLVSPCQCKFSLNRQNMDNILPFLENEERKEKGWMAIQIDMEKV